MVAKPEGICRMVILKERNAVELKDLLLLEKSPLKGVGYREREISPLRDDEAGIALWRIVSSFAALVIQLFSLYGAVSYWSGV
ncbi:hypothetical protein [Ravibacter arvi]|uniref:hypothetical protein n=1 Tax=Ravibacter arvi TaxID=2051041 RepID=UPI0031EF5AA5